MFLFSIKKGKEKFLVDNKKKYDFSNKEFLDSIDLKPIGNMSKYESAKMIIPDTHEFAQCYCDSITKILESLAPGKYTFDPYILGAYLLPYDLIIPRCKNPYKYYNYLCYWGSSTAILNWFVKNVQCGVNDDKWHAVSSEDLEILKSTCETVIANSELPLSGPLDDESYYSQLIKNPTVAKELLPIADGSRKEEYNGRYLMQLKYTVEKLEKVLKETDFDKVTVFFNSWR